MFHYKCVLLVTLIIHPQNLHICRVYSIGYTSTSCIRHCHKYRIVSSVCQTSVLFDKFDGYKVNCHCVFHSLCMNIHYNRGAIGVHNLSLTWQQTERYLLKHSYILACCSDNTQVKHKFARQK